MYRQREYLEGDRIKLAKFVVLCGLYKKFGYFLNRPRMCLKRWHVCEDMGLMSDVDLPTGSP